MTTVGTVSCEKCGHPVIMANLETQIIPVALDPKPRVYSVMLLGDIGKIMAEPERSSMVEHQCPARRDQ